MIQKKKKQQTTALYAFHIGSERFTRFWQRYFFFSSRRRHTRWPRDWSSDVCSSDLPALLSTVRSSVHRARSRWQAYGAPHRAAVRGIATRSSGRDHRRERVADGSGPRPPQHASHRADPQKVTGEPKP